MTDSVKREADRQILGVVLRLAARGPQGWVRDTDGAGDAFTFTVPSGRLRLQRPFRNSDLVRLDVFGAGTREVAQAYSGAFPELERLLAQVEAAEQRRLGERDSIIAAILAELAED